MRLQAEEANRTLVAWTDALGCALVVLVGSQLSACTPTAKTAEGSAGLCSLGECNREPDELRPTGKDGSVENETSIVESGDARGEDRQAGDKRDGAPADGLDAGAGTEQDAGLEAEPGVDGGFEAPMGGDLDGSTRTGDTGTDSDRNDGSTADEFNEAALEDAGGETCDGGEAAGDTDCGDHCEACPPPLLDLGSPCGSDSECKSGHCPAQDGLCCDLPCDSLCMACAGSKTEYTDGVCAPVTAATDPDLECPAEDPSTCGVSGSGCDGATFAPACLLYDQQTECQPSYCTGARVFTPAYCGADGTCGPVSFASKCTPYACADDGLSCRGSCAEDRHCAGNHICEDGTCTWQPPKPPPATEAELLWAHAFFRDPGDMDNGSLTLYGLWGAGNGDAVFHGSCSGPSFLNLPCSIYDAPFTYRIASDGTRLGGEAGFRGRGPTWASAATGAFVVGETTNSAGSCCGANVTAHRTDGSEAWSRSFGGSEQNHTSLLQLAITPAGTVYAHFTGSPEGVSYGGDPAPGSQLVKYNPAGQFLEQRHWPFAAQLRGAKDGGLFVATGSENAEAVGCGAATGSASFYLARLDADGACRWSRPIGDTGARRLAVTATGDLVIAVPSTVTLDFGSGPIVPPDQAGIWVAKLDGDSGEPHFRNHYPGATLGQLAVTADGAIVLAGGLTDETSFGGPLLSADLSYLVKLDPDGSYAGQHQLPAPDYMAVTPSGDVLVMGTNPDLNFPDQPEFTPPDTWSGWPAQIVLVVGSVRL